MESKQSAFLIYQYSLQFPHKSSMSLKRHLFLDFNIYFSDLYILKQNVFELTT